MEEKKRVVILLAEDDEDDYILTKEVLESSRVTNQIHWVKDGVELMEYLRGQGRFEDRSKHPFPDLILLDLNMPRKDGRESLKEIKEDPDLCTTPTVVLTTSKQEEDIVVSYGLGVNSFIQKPVRFEEFIDVVKTLGKYWFEIVTLP